MFLAVAGACAAALDVSHGERSGGRSGAPDCQLTRYGFSSAGFSFALIRPFSNLTPDAAGRRKRGAFD